VKTLVWQLAKLGVSAAVIALLIYQIVADESFGELREQPIQWHFLGLAVLIALSAVWVTFVRWFVLVRALDLPFELRDAFRLGSLGYMLNLVLIGNVGGDLVKAVVMAGEQPGRRTAAVTTILADRLVGMYSLILMAAAGIYLTGVADQIEATPTIRLVFRAAMAAAALGTAIALLVFIPGFSSPRMVERARRVPWVGDVLASLLETARAYRDKWRVLALALLLSLVSNSLFTLALFTIATALPGNHPTLAHHFVLIPLGTASGMLPAPFGAFGPYEAMMKYLYGALLPTAHAKGLWVALTYRLVTVVVAAIGATFFVVGRRDVAAAVRAARRAEAEAAPESAGGEMASHPEVAS
jgi:uncharacterized protein (TIRG00374 family)